MIYSGVGSAKKPTSILQGIRNFNLICWAMGHNFANPVPFLNTAKTGYCGNVKTCTRCPKQKKEFN